MNIEFSLLFVAIAVVCWGFGDFFIQKYVRKFGDWETLFVITIFGAVVLTPFIIKDLPQIFNLESLLILLIGSAILSIAALFDFEALRKGKLAVVEPIWSLEIVASTTLAFLVLGEAISLKQGILAGLLVVGLVLVSLKSYHFNKKIWLEKGVIIAVLAAATMGTANFFIGYGSRLSNALVMNWFLNTFMAILCAGYLIYNKRMRSMFQDVKKETKVFFWMCLFDNSAWVAFAVAMTLAPIGITVALSESYIIIAVILGMVVNKEYLMRHQKFGLVLAIVSAMLLASTL